MSWEVELYESARADSQWPSSLPRLNRMNKQKLSGLLIFWKNSARKSECLRQTPEWRSLGIARAVRRPIVPLAVFR